MTSQKSLKNNVNLNDFKRSLLGSILFPAIALIVLFITMTAPVISYVTSEEFLMTKDHTEISMFISPISDIGYMFSILPIGMVLCGMLTAVKSFYFMLSKKQVNVFFSLGVTRKTMFINRTLAGIITLCIAVLIPMAVIYIINISVFGYVAHATSLFLYVVSLFFISGLAGFGIGAAATMISGNIFEVALTALSASFLPLLAVTTGAGLLISFLKGYVSISSISWWLGLVSPYHMMSSVSTETVINMYGYEETRSALTLLGLLDRGGVDADKYVIPDTAKVDWGFITPILVWLAISVVLIAVGYILYKARKAEHANSFGSFAISRAINTTVVFALLAYLIDEMFWRSISPIVYFIILAVVALIAYFVIQLIMTRKIKATLKSLKWYGVLISVTAVFLAVVASGLFGTYNKTPEKAEVKSVSISADVLSPYEHYIHPGNGDEDFVESSTDESKETIIGLFDKLKEEKVLYGENYIAGVTFAFRDKNDEVKYREFYIYSEELYVEYIKAVYGSDFFDLILKEYLINDSSPQVDEYIPSDEIIYYGDTNNSAGHLKGFSWGYVSGTGLYQLDEDNYPQAEYVEDVDALCKALYNDLTKMTYEQLFERAERPVGILGAGSDYMGNEAMHKSDMIQPTNGSYVELEISGKYGLVGTAIPVYADMTETIAFLNANGYSHESTKLTVEEVLYTDSPLDIRNALQKFYKVNENSYDENSYYDYWIYNILPYITFSSEYLNYYTFEATGAYIREGITNLDMLKKVYKDAGHPLTSVTDTAKAEAITDKTVTQYMVYGDNGRYVYVVYEEGPIVCYYLPEANVSVLK